MQPWIVVLYAVGAVIVFYALVVATLVLFGRWSAARTVARFVPDCIVLFRRLLRDPRVPRRQKFLVAALIAYMAMPFDLVLDAIPVIGELDDAVLALLVLRSIMRSAGEATVRELWPGPPEALEILVATAFGRDPSPGRDR